MNFLQRLVKLANTLDKKGLYDEAQEIDRILAFAASPVETLDHNYAKELADALNSGFSPYTSPGQAFKKEVLDLYERGEGLEKIMQRVSGRYSNLISLDSQLQKIMPSFTTKTQQIASYRAQAQQQQVAQQQGDTPQGQAGQGAATKPKAKPNPRTQGFQQQYNALRKQLVQAGMPLAEVKQQFPWIKPDGFWGRQTTRVLGPPSKNPVGLQKIRDTLAKLKQKAQQPAAPAAGQAGAGAKQPPATPQQQQAEQQVGRAGQEAGALFGEANKLRRELMQGGSHKSTSSLVTAIQDAMKGGISLADAVKKVRQNYGL